MACMTNTICSYERGKTLVMQRGQKSPEDASQRSDKRISRTGDCQRVTALPRREGIGRPVVALSIVILVLGGTLGLVLVSPQSVMKEQTTTTTVTSTLTPTQQAVEMASDSFAQHLALFTSRNVSALVAQYEPTANVTWIGLSCWSGIYPNAGNSSGDLTKLLNIFFDNTKTFLGYQGFDAVFVGNITRTSVITTTGGSFIVNSTFGLLGQASTGNFTATVSAQDSYAYSRTNDTWLISQETWHFLTYHIPDNVLICAIT
jgi:hypothetical protein